MKNFIYLLIILLSLTAILSIIVLLFFKYSCFRESHTKKYSDPEKPFSHGLKIYAGMATIPERSKNLWKIIDSIINQIDHLYVHVNYKLTDQIPSCLNSPKITISHAKKYGDLGDTGKFFNLCREKFNTNAYLLTLDDDIIYPHNYVQNMIIAANKYKNKAIITYHGGILPPHVRSYKNDRNLVYFNGKNNEDKFVNIMGTGVTLYPPKLLKLKLNDFKRPNSADLYVSIIAQKQKIPIVLIKHNKSQFNTINYNHNLWNLEIKSNSNLAELNTQTARQHTWTVHKI